MPLIQLLEVLIVVGVLLWLVNRFIPMQSNHQVNSERRCGDRRGVVAAERFRAVSFAIPDPRGLIAVPVRKASRQSNVPPQVITAIRQTSALRRNFENQALLARRNRPQFERVCSNQFAQTNLSVEPMSPTPTFRVTVISRSVQAVNYQHRSGAPSWISRART